MPQTMMISWLRKRMCLMWLLHSVDVQLVFAYITTLLLKKRQCASPCIAIIWNVNTGMEKQLFSQYSKFFREICAGKSNECISNHWRTNNYCKANEHLHARTKISTTTSGRKDERRNLYSGEWNWIILLLMRGLLAITHKFHFKLCLYWLVASACLKWITES